MSDFIPLLNKLILSSYYEMGLQGCKKAKRQTPHSEFIFISATGIATSLLSFALVLFLFFSINEAEQKEYNKNDKKDKFSGVLHQKRVKDMFD
ncbi:MULTISPECIES: hypothetical protein [Peribacillus]|uniref:hypothetical protein n=1 Tax=Peribacillus TaxID=2675229 RepID=UPI0013A5CCE3|nr:hypothetical protein [Peribacillus frigoritolerans]MEC0346191.1 hypothetical protein [Peribacillus castrilensis]